MIYSRKRSSGLLARGPPLALVCDCSTLSPKGKPVPSPTLCYAHTHRL